MQIANCKLGGGEAELGEVEVLEIAVSDTGVGIPAEALETIFEEFQQVKGEHQKQKGTGLGLPIAKGWTELLGGTIRVESEVGKGSIFTITIPVTYPDSENKSS